jgi:hypothetical protein
MTEEKDWKINILGGGGGEGVGGTTIFMLRVKDTCDVE